jgi:hypothetical protein
MRVTTHAETVEALVIATFVGPVRLTDTEKRDLLSAASRERVTNFELLHARVSMRAGGDDPD